MAKYTAVNSRRFKRVHAHSIVKYHSVEKYNEAEPFISNVKDLSAGGMRFWSESFFPEGKLLRISAWIPVLQRPFDALARVVRVRPALHSDIYYLSVRFIEASSELQTALNDFIESLASNPKTRRFIDDEAKVKREIAGKI